MTIFWLESSKIFSVLIENPIFDQSKEKKKDKFEDHESIFETTLV